MKILFLCPKINLDKPSGGTLHYLDLAESLASKDNVEVYLVASGKKNVEKRKNLTIISMPDINTSIFRIHKDFRKIRKINSIIEEIDPDFIYFRTEPFELYPVFFPDNRPSIIEVSYNLFSKSYDVSKIVYYLWSLRNFMLRAWIKKAVSKFGSILVVSESSKKYLEKRITNKDIFVVRTGVNLRKFGQKKQRRTGKKIVFVGNGLKYQGVHLLIEASRILDNEDVGHKVVIIGDYSKKISGAQKNIEVLGPLSNKNAVKTMLGCDIGVAPYIEAENEPFGFSPVKVLEYMAAGLAVVATDTEWNMEIIRPGANGLLFKSNDAQDLADKLKTLLNSKKLMKSIQNNNSSEAKNSCNWDKISEHIIDIARNSI
ncbi:MAG: glycosyltransferase family 4 protein [Candidatus Doudnabacteria bacterium]|nr:glycosyltransferase family 4 protein [Candidatus Doudnabacteria bacterium]